MASSTTGHGATDSKVVVKPFDDARMDCRHLGSLIPLLGRHELFRSAERHGGRGGCQRQWSNS